MLAENNTIMLAIVSIIWYGFYMASRPLKPQVFVKGVPVLKESEEVKQGRVSASKGGKARADQLSKEDRQEIARQAALTRWNQQLPILPQATHVGTIEIGDKQISCAVLENGRRLLTQETFLIAVGRAGKARGDKGSVKLNRNPVESLPPFLSENLRPFFGDDLQQAVPIVFRTLRGIKAYGYDAELLPMVCEVYLKARDAGALMPNQEHLAKACDVLMRGLARVGIIALVDEATGYQETRARDELNRILERYISAELLPWTKKFPDAFFKEIYRLHGWEYKPGSYKRPGYVGTLINELIYNQLPPGVLPELRRKNPVMPKGYRKYKHFQFLTEETGNPHLDKQIVSVMTLMRVSDNKEMFHKLFEKAFPKAYEQLSLFSDEDEGMELL